MSEDVFKDFGLFSTAPLMDTPGQSIYRFMTPWVGRKWVTVTQLTYTSPTVTEELHRLRRNFRLGEWQFMSRNYQRCISWSVSS